MPAEATKPLLYDYFDKSVDLLLMEYERSKLQQASLNMGNNRELFCNQFLSHVLPHSLGIGSGEIWDGQGNRTGQLDTIIVRDDTPTLTFGKVNTYLAEGVFAVVEVKSNLTRKKLQEALETLKPVKALALHREGLSILSRSPETTLARPMRCVFAYEGATWQTLADEIEIQNAWDVIDILCILDQGALVRNGLFLQWQDDVKFGVVQGKAAALAMLYFHLATFVTDFIARTVSVRPYFEPFDKWSEGGCGTILAGNKD